MSEKKRNIEKLWEKAIINKKKYQNKPYHQIKELCYLEWEKEIPSIRFGLMNQDSNIGLAFSTRFGGVSKGYLSEMNLGFSRGDSLETVEKNYRLFCDAIHVKASNLVLSDQIHETQIKYVKKEDTCGNKIIRKLKGIDGLMTDQEEICLATSYADCVPLFFADEKNHVIASSHSGWRGTVGKIGQKTVDHLCRQFGSSRKEIKVVIGPSICQKCYEVSLDVIDEFRQNYTEKQMEEIAYCSDVKNQKYQLDLWAANYFQLIDAGISKDNIYVSEICTCCNHNLLFSHRASKGKRGNLNGFMWIKKRQA